MVWVLQNPGDSVNLVQTISDASANALSGGGAFAFASATGVKLLAAEPPFQHLMRSYTFRMIVGLDAITDTKALDELRLVQSSYSGFSARAFLNSKPGSCFHPKTIWFRYLNGGIAITGSGNLTSGGLQGNWEAFWVQNLGAAEIDAVETAWNNWVAINSSSLLSVDDPRAIERANTNSLQRARLHKIAVNSAIEPEVAELAFFEVSTESSLSPVLIAEVPRSGDRWNQVNFDLDTYQQYFGVTLGSPRDITLYSVLLDGSLDAPEHRHAVSVASRNFRFEIGAARGLAYPNVGHPILICQQIASATFKYVLLLPDDPNHSRMQTYLNTNYARSGNQKLRVRMTAADLAEIWPECPTLA